MRLPLNPGRATWRRLSSLGVVICCSACAGAGAPLSLLPAPQLLTRGQGTWAPAESLVVSVSDSGNAELHALGRLAADLVSATLRRTVTVSGGAPTRDAAIRLRLDSATRHTEGYRLEILRGGVDLRAPTGAGLFYGLQTLRQLLESASPRAGRLAVPAVIIADAPRFAWRGLHLDAGRHFFPVDFIKRYIDLMARYKLNTFHWHLTDDQGWRLEIRKYPRLTTVGGCRRETMVEKHFEPYVGDGVRYCGFYTQDEVRDVVAYARSRYVTIVPEIEMPGHAKAALAAHPELACTPGPFEVRTTWGVDDDVFCPSEPTFRFIEDVLSEVMELFPGRYIHIGGDEVPKTRWRESATAQDVMRREGLKDEHELQSWFIRRVERFLVPRGRRLIGWDEILEGGLAPEATVMSWRGTGGGIAAARARHDVIMSPNSHLYFDHYQGDARFEPLAIGGMSPLERVYQFEPVPDSLTSEEARYILGAQANVWTEYLKTPGAVEYMVFPRALALAEVVWSPRERRSWHDFVARLPAALRSLEAMRVNYRVPHVEGLDGDVLTLSDRWRIRLRTPLPDATIRYTTDGTDPTGDSPRYRGPFEIPVTADGVRVAARAFTNGGRVSAARAATVTRTRYRDADTLAGPSSAGLRYAYYESAVRSVRDIDTLVPARRGIRTSVSRRGDERAERFAILLSGYLRIPTDGMYTFALTSDDGSSLVIGDRVVVDNDGFHGAEERAGMIALRAGLHPMTLRYFQGGGGAALLLRYRRGAGPWRDVPDAWLVHVR